MGAWHWLPSRAPGMGARDGPEIRGPETRGPETRAPDMGACGTRLSACRRCSLAAGRNGGPGASRRPRSRGTTPGMGRRRDRPWDRRPAPRGGAAGAPGLWPAVPGPGGRRAAPRFGRSGLPSKPLRSSETEGRSRLAPIRSRFGRPAFIEARETPGAGGPLAPGVDPSPLTRTCVDHDQESDRASPTGRVRPGPKAVPAARRSDPSDANRL